MRAVLAILVLSTVLVGCGDDRPSEEEIAEALRGPLGDTFLVEDPPADDEIFDCLARELHESPASDGELRDFLGMDVHTEPDFAALEAVVDELDAAGTVCDRPANG